MPQAPLTFAPPGHGHEAETETETGTEFRPRFDANGLVGAIVTDAATGEVLMFAWMNANALSETLRSGVAHFWSRSRDKLWKKGEESGNLMDVVELRVDCDQDALWLKVTVRGVGVACHTGARSCFYRRAVYDGSTATVTLHHDQTR